MKQKINKTICRLIAAIFTASLALQTINIPTVYAMESINVELPVISDSKFIAEITPADESAIAISTAEELSKLEPNKSYVLKNDIDLKDYHSVSWDPLNISGNIVLDGAGHKISNLLVYRDDECKNAGLFGSVQNLTVKNLGFENVNIYGSETAGAIAGSFLDATVENCYAEGTVKSAGNAGGLTGSGKPSFTDSYFKGKVSAATSGGIAGYSSSSSTDFKNCLAEGTINGTSTAGGIIGTASSWNSNTIINTINCGFTGTVTGKESAGGIVGHLSATNNMHSANMDNCMVNAEINSEIRAGGLISDVYNIKVKDCLVRGKITTQSPEDANEHTYNQLHAGGLCTYSFVTEALNCGNEADIVLANTNKNYGIAGSYSNAGGLFTTASNGSIKNCYSKGNIDVISQHNSAVGALLGDGSGLIIDRCEAVGNINVSSMDVNSYSAESIGGAIGKGGNLKVYNCTYSGDISFEYDGGNFFPQIRVGGFIGQTFESNIGNTKIMCCENTGKITAKICNVRTEVGGFIGEVNSNENNITELGDCHANTDIDYEIIGGSSQTTGAHAHCSPFCGYASRIKIVNSDSAGSLKFYGAFNTDMAVGTVVGEARLTAVIGKSCTSTSSLEFSENIAECLGEQAQTPAIVGKYKNLEIIDDSEYLYDDIKNRTLFKYGAACADETITAADSAAILQKVLNDSYIMPIEAKTDDYMNYIDVDIDGRLTASDAVTVLQKVLNGEFVMPIEK